MPNRTNSDIANIGNEFRLNKLLLKKSYQIILNLNVQKIFIDKMTAVDTLLTQKS